MKCMIHVIKRDPIYITIQTSQPNHTLLAIEAKVLAKQTNKQTKVRKNQ